MTKSILTLLLTSTMLVSAQSVIAAGDAAAGKEKSAVCAACHGEGGHSEIPFNPTLAGQYADYIIRALKDYKSGDRQNAIMAGMAAPLTEQDMEDLAAYFSSQDGLKTLPNP